MRFADRRQAGVLLGRVLGRYAGPDVRVLALPRGGVPVAVEVGRALDARVEPFLVRKLGVPGHEELAMGAIASGGGLVLRDEIIDALGISRDEIDAAIARERRELARREQAYGARPPDVRGKTALVVDDGLATGSTMRAAVRALRSLGAARIVVAVPVAPPSTCAELAEEADEVVCPDQPEPFFAVGQWYEDFHPVDDDEVLALLHGERAPLET